MLLTAYPAVSQAVIAPAEFEPQEYIWLSWYDEGFLGGEPFSTRALAVIREITPSVKVRLLYGDDGPGAAPAPDVLAERLRREGVDTSRVELFYYPRPIGSIQDPAPFFLDAGDEGLVVADYRYNTSPDPRAEVSRAACWSTRRSHRQSKP